MVQDESYQVSSFLRKTFLMISKGFQAQCESEARQAHLRTKQELKLGRCKP